MDHAGIFQNLDLWSAVVGWLAAQTVKLIRETGKSGRVDWSYYLSTGGMPSAHSAFVCALAASVGLSAGFDTPLFAVALAFAGVVMFDAQSVRRAAGTQARLLNQLVEELFTEHHLSEHKLAELLGHTPVEVFIGMVTGIIAALAVHAVAG
ncbi:divergent PAP2 family protein [Kiritimatiella glycovorans]|uniref:Divergent PAP2 family protein n=1 Tax=Kiritimatiella glycovorans TaxID=1307763 RepID=A0A0G3EDG2_9BACT|nr:divergent PAP2 family protein [Kiritimatiella glycovorans]AKJ64343.1 Divergent PAP2 family protein [Kiritimatiella glycovorans]